MNALCNTNATPAAFPARVLVADDDRANRVFLRAVLRMRGSEVAVASDGMEAWSKLRKGHFDALITDCEMPKWSGLELLGAARRSADGSIADIPAVLASSVTASDFLERIRELRETFFLPKPIDPEQLIVMLELIQRRRLRQWKQRRERASDTFTRDEREY